MKGLIFKPLEAMQLLMDRKLLVSPSFSWRKILRSVGIQTETTLGIILEILSKNCQATLKIS